MGDTKKDISEKVEQVMRESITGDKHIEIPLYERRKANHRVLWLHGFLWHLYRAHHAFYLPG